MKVYNHDIASLIERLRDFRFELIKSVSSGLSEFNQFDKDRVYSYLNAIDQFHAYVSAAPQLDLPESSPREIELPDMVPPIPTENHDIKYIARMFDVIEIEMANCQSARKPMGLMSFDSMRLTANVSKIKDYLDNFVSVVTPLDRPESAPEIAMTGDGRKGV